jgi:chromosome segregation ATPase
MADEITDSEALDLLNRLDKQQQAFSKVGALVRKYAQAKREVDSMDAQIEAKKASLKGVMASLGNASEEHIKALDTLKRAHAERMADLQAKYDAQMATHQAQLKDAVAETARQQARIAALKAEAEATQKTLAEQVHAKQVEAGATMANLDKQIAARQAILQQAKDAAKQQAKMLQEAV